MKTRTLLLATAMFLALSAVAFSQVAVYSVSSTPITTVIATGNAEPAGDITFTQTGGTTVNNPVGTITIQYGGNNVNITSNFSNAQIVNCTGGYLVAAACTPTVLGFPTSQYSPGLMVISVPAGVANGTFTITGVKVQINGAGLTSLTANISATGNQIAAGSTVVTVINSTTGAGIAPNSVNAYHTTALPIANLSAATAGTPLINGVTGAITNTNGSTFSSTELIKVGEGFLGGWSKNVGVRITVSATPPKGVTFTFPTTATSYDASGTNTTGANAKSNWVRGISTSTTAQTSAAVISSSSTSSSSLQVYYYVATDAGSTTVETLYIPVTIAVDTTTAVFPFPATSFTFVVSLAPVQPAYVNNVPAGLEPRFAALDVGPANLCVIQGSSTTLLVPYAYASKSLGDFNTGFAIMNTSKDPGLSVLGFTGATINSGPVTFYLYPMDDTANVFKFATNDTTVTVPGSGLGTGGVVPAGGGYVVYLSQIFPLAKNAADGTTLYAKSIFQGYVIAYTGFTNAHGLFVITNGSTLTLQSTLMMVLSDRSVLPEKVGF